MTRPPSTGMINAGKRSPINRFPGFIRASSVLEQSASLINQILLRWNFPSRRIRNLERFVSKKVGLGIIIGGAKVKAIIVNAVEVYEMRRVVIWLGGSKRFKESELLSLVIF